MVGVGGGFLDGFASNWGSVVGILLDVIFLELLLELVG
jgi:hypothetical protein